VKLRRVDLGQVVLVAAAATGRHPGDVLATADLTLLALITARVRQASTPGDAAAEMLVGVVAGRPFSVGNHRAAWALASHVADARRSRIGMVPDDAVALVRSVASGRLDEREVAVRLQDAMHRRHSVHDAFARMFEMPPPPGIVVWACPECGRGVPVPPCRSSIFLTDPLPDDVVADCAARHRAHDPGHRLGRHRSLRPFAVPARESEDRLVRAPTA